MKPKLNDDKQVHPTNTYPVLQAVQVVGDEIHLLHKPEHWTHEIVVKTGEAYAVYPAWQVKQFVPELQVSQPTGHATQLEFER